MYETGGRTVRVQPRLQIVARIVACVTAGLRTPGVSPQLARTTDALRPPGAARQAVAATSDRGGEQADLDE